MALLAPKRPRVSRTARMRPAPAASSRVDDLLRDQSLLLRWLIAILAVISLTLVVEAWRPPFPYRLGDFVSDGITARIQFHREDKPRTERMRDDRESEVVPIFRLDAGLIDRLSGQLRENLREVAAADSLDMLSNQTRIDFGLVTPEGGPGGDAVTLRGDFEALAASVRPAPRLIGSTSVGCGAIGPTALAGPRSLQPLQQLEVDLPPAQRHVRSLNEQPVAEPKAHAVARVEEGVRALVVDVTAAR